MKTARGWQDANCPLGEGMVDWRYVFGVLCRAGFQGPISLHLEYDVAGATTAEREASVMAAASRDLRVREGENHGGVPLTREARPVAGLTP